MPARDHHHEAVKNALQKDGWLITHDPRTIMLPERALFIDLRASRIDEEIAVLVEIKGFGQDSQIEALAEALGKYNLYRTALELNGVKEPLYLAIPQAAYNGIVSETIGQQIIRDYGVKVLVYDPDTEAIIQWLP
ncbi:MAG: fatty-acid synthase [Anaerolineae bacterium]|nr:fatty-acid synthase [Anaerolineae bacterium]